MSHFDDHESEITGLGMLRTRRQLTGPSSGMPYDQQPDVAPADRIWTTADGERIRMGDMTQAHRTNVVRMLVRKYGEWARSTPTGRALVACGIDTEELDS